MTSSSASSEQWANIGGREIPYVVERRSVKHPRLEFKTGRLIIILPRGRESEDSLLERRAGWILKKHSIIELARERVGKRASGSDLLVFGRPFPLKRNDERQFQKHLKRLLKGRIKKTIQHYGARLGVKPGKIFIKKQTTKWGSCSYKGNVSFNLRLVSLPERTIRYVVFHEMLHLVEKEHNNSFWETLRGEFSDYERLEKELLEYWFFTVNQKYFA